MPPGKSAAACERSHIFTTAGALRPAEQASAIDRAGKWGSEQTRRFVSASRKL